MKNVLFLSVIQNSKTQCGAAKLSSYMNELLQDHRTFPSETFCLLLEDLSADKFLSTLAFRVITRLIQRLHRADTVFVNFPVTGVNLIIYALGIAFLSRIKSTIIVYHGYFHVNRFHSLVASLLLLGTPKVRLSVCEDLKDSMHSAWKRIYKNIKFSLFFVPPLLTINGVALTTTTQLSYLLSSCPAQPLHTGAYLFHYGILSPNKDVNSMLEIAYRLRLPLLVPSSDDSFGFLKSLSHEQASYLKFIPVPTDVQLINLIKYSSACVNVPVGGLGHWSSTWALQRCIGKLVLSVHDDDACYNADTHTFYFKKNVCLSFAQTTQDHEQLINQIKYYSAVTRPTMSLSTLKLSNLAILLNSLS